MDRTATPLFTRRTLWLLVLSAALLTFTSLGLATALWWLGWARSDGSQEGVVELNAQPAPDFTLIDQNEQPVQLSELRGKVVVLTFLYTSCPDVCPLTAQKLATAFDLLEPSRQREVAILAVTVDPEQDTPARLRQYLDANRLSGKLTFLTGDRATLEQVWSSYGIGVMRQPLPDNPKVYTVGHTTVTYVIDKEGRQRVLLRDEEIAPQSLAERLAGLIEE
jgi:protein SCO1/2